jgi:hypothetical protein
VEVNPAGTLFAVPEAVALGIGCAGFALEAIVRHGKVLAVC